LECALTIRTAPDEQGPAPASVPVQPAVTRSGWNLWAAFARLPTFQALEHRDFRLLWISQGCGSLSMWMDQVARGWLLYDLTSSPLQLGLMRGAQALPLLLLSPVAGTAADRYDRKVQIIIAQVMNAVLYGLVALLIVTGQIQPWHIYATAFAEGVVSTFQHPARLAMMADAVPPNRLTNAVALGSVLFNVSRSIGPAIAGLLIWLVGAAGSYVAQAGLCVVGTALTFPLPAYLRFATGEGVHHARPSFVRATADGWSYGWNNHPVRAALLITTSASLFIIPFSTLLPVVARDILDVGAPGQGLLLTGMGIGAFCSAVLIASLGDRLPRGILMLVGVTAYGLSVMAFSASPWFPLSVGLMVVVGLFHVSSHALVHTVIQTYTEREYRGRMNGIFQQTHVITLVGATVVGGLASALGAPTAIALMAGAGALASVAIGVLVPIARRIR
jgi:MFS family permease